MAHLGGLLKKQSKMEKRSNEAYQTILYALIEHDVLVVCPSCEGLATVRTGGEVFPKKVTAVCASCGFNKPMEISTHRLDERQQRGQVKIYGAPVDPFFHLPVWLQADFEGETLWAYNHEHLDLLAAHIGAKLRERTGQPFKNRSIGARLPGWMTSAKNRKKTLKVIEKLRLK